MVTASNLMRSNSNDNHLNVQANANNIGSIDCGIRACSACNSPACQRMGTTRTFLAVLVVAGILQGAVETYFRISAKQVALQYEYDPVVIDWLLAVGGICQGVAAILIAYWGNRIHRTAWFGSIFMLQAVIAIMAVIPTIVYHDTGSTLAYKVSDLCDEREIENFISEKPYIVTTLIMLFVTAMGIGLGNIAFYSLGLSYMDDNLKEHESPAFLGAALGARFWGIQFGSGVAFFVEALPLGWWLGWTILSPVVFTIGLLVSLFPKRLLKTAVQLAANRILETISNSSENVMGRSQYLADIHFLPSLRRLVSNKILIFNVTALMFLQTGLINYIFYEEDYLQSRFFLPTSEADGLHDEWTSRLISFMLTPPLVGLSILVAGLIIAKVNPRPRKLAIWNVITASLVAAFLIAFVFIRCSNSTIAGGERGRLSTPHCSNKCICPVNVPFTPTCPSNSIQTFYSPCHAGCSDVKWINNVKIYTNCTCGADAGAIIEGGEASDGACNNESCQIHWILFQSLEAIMFALLGSGVVGNLLITIRSVLPQDKSLALSFELCAVGIFAYIPGKLIYDLISRKTCQLWDHNGTRCHIHETPLFGNWMDITTAAFVLLSVIFDALVYYYVEYISIYGEEDYDEMLGSMRVVPRNFDEPSPAGTVQLPLVQSSQASPPPEEEEHLLSTTQPQVVYTEIQRPGFKKIFNPTPDNSVPSTPIAEGYPSSPTTERVLSPDSPPATPERVSSFRDTNIPPTGGVPSILRAISPLSEESTTSSPTPESPTTKEPKKLGFKDRFMKQPLRRLNSGNRKITNIQEEPSTSAENADSPIQQPKKEPAPAVQRPLSPETDF